jgi:IclR family acetate operon transcriptional repressor
MSDIIERSFKIIEELASFPTGRTLSELSTELDMPLSATHRLLNDLIKAGYVRKDERHGDFSLTTKLVSIGLRVLSASGIVDIAQPILERLAGRTGELVRLAAVDGDQLLYIAKAQGATQGLRYDPEMGRAVRLSCSAAGYVWLSSKSDEEALRLVSLQGFEDPAKVGPAAPSTIKGVLTHVRATRKRGFGLTVDLFLPAMSSMAAPVYGHDGAIRALLIVAGPIVRLTEKRMLALAPVLLSTAEELGRASSVSPMLNRRPEGKSVQATL